MWMDDFRIGTVSSGADGSAQSHTACELQVEGLFQMCAAFFPEGADMEPKKASGGHYKQCVEQRVEGLDGVKPEIDENDRKAPSDLLPLSVWRSLRVGHHVKREQIEARRSQHAQDESLHRQVVPKDITAQQGLQGVEAKERNDQ